MDRQVALGQAIHSRHLNILCLLPVGFQRRKGRSNVLGFLILKVYPIQPMRGAMGRRIEAIKAVQIKVLLHRRRREEISTANGRSPMT